MKRPDVTLLAVGARAFDGCRSGWLIEDAVDESSLQGQQLSRDWRCCLFIVLVPQLSHSVSLLFSCTKKKDKHTHTPACAQKKVLFASPFRSGSSSFLCVYSLARFCLRKKYGSLWLLFLEFYLKTKLH